MVFGCRVRLITGHLRFTEFERHINQVIYVIGNTGRI